MGSKISNTFPKITVSERVAILDAIETKPLGDQSRSENLPTVSEAAKNAGFGNEKTARKYMQISHDNRLSNGSHVNHLPNSWGTLYELTTLTDDQFNDCLENGIISPDMQRKDITNYKKELAEI